MLYLVMFTAKIKFPVTQVLFYSLELYCTFLIYYQQPNGNIRQRYIFASIHLHFMYLRRHLKFRTCLCRKRGDFYIYISSDTLRVNRTRSNKAEVYYYTLSFDFLLSVVLLRKESREMDICACVLQNLLMEQNKAVQKVATGKYSACLKYLSYYLTLDV